MNLYFSYISSGTLAYEFTFRESVIVISLVLLCTFTLNKVRLCEFTLYVCEFIIQRHHSLKFTLDSCEFVVRQHQLCKFTLYLCEFIIRQHWWYEFINLYEFILIQVHLCKITICHIKTQYSSHKVLTLGLVHQAMSVHIKTLIVLYMAA
jgi:hypothetical protein